MNEEILPIWFRQKRMMGQVKSPTNFIVEETGRIRETRNGNNEVRKRDTTIEGATSPGNGREREEETVAPDIEVEVGERKGEVEQNPRTREAPPNDDCCSICFGDFDIPCRTNCGHWFCARCILMLWSYNRGLQHCKCPICTRHITELTPEASLTLRQEEEVVETLKKVERYNRLYVGGARGLITKVHELPLLFKRCLGGMIDPNRLRLNYYTARLIALLVAIFYDICGFDFLPTGRLGSVRLFQYAAMAFVLLLFAVGLVHRLVLYLRVRRLAPLLQ